MDVKWMRELLREEGIATADFDEGSIKETGLDGLVILTVCLKYCRTEI